MRALLAGLVLMLGANPAAAAMLYAPANTADARTPQADFDPFLQPVEPDPLTSLDDARMQSRQTRMRWHQGLGLATLGLVTAQAALGQSLLNRQDANVFDDTTNSIRTAHMATGIASTVTYVGAAALAFTAPDVEHEGRGGSITAHRALAWVHGAGMLLTPTLGVYSRRAGPEMDADSLRRIKTVHQVSGYVTAAALWGAALVIVWD